MQWNNNFNDYNSLNSLQLEAVPAWARAEHFEQSVGLNKLWSFSSQVKRAKRHPLRRKIARRLYKLAREIDFAEESANPNLGYAKA